MKKRQYQHFITVHDFIHESKYKYLRYALGVITVVIFSLFGMFLHLKGQTQYIQAQLMKQEVNFSHLSIGSVLITEQFKQKVFSVEILNNNITPEENILVQWQNVGKEEGSFFIGSIVGKGVADIVIPYSDSCKIIVQVPGKEDKNPADNIFMYRLSQ